MIPHVTDSALTLEFLRPDGFSLETPFGWGIMVDGQERPRRAAAAGHRGQEEPAGAAHAPARPRRRGRHRAPRRRTSRTSWPTTRTTRTGRRIDHRHRVAQVTVPVSSIGGWYDIFLPGQLRDFQVLQAAGRPARLTVGPWTHLSIGRHRRCGRPWSSGWRYARGEPPPPRRPGAAVRDGRGEPGATSTSWPPPGYSPTRLHLGAGRRGCGARAARAESAAGPVPLRPGGPDARRSAARGWPGRRPPWTTPTLEARPDVLTYTTAPLEPRHRGDRRGQRRDLVPAPAWRYADVFVRLCDVRPATAGRGTSATA